MDVKAILVIAAPASGSTKESLGGLPIAILPVLGKPVVQHVAERLMRAGIDSIAVVCDAIPNPYLRPAQHPALKWLQPGSNSDLWRTAENVFNGFIQAGADLVLALRLGAYAELDFETLLQFHLDQRNRVTAAVDSEGPLDAFVISASRRNDAAFMFRHKFGHFRSPCGHFLVPGYVNRLTGAHDLRNLATDSLLLKTEITPAGTQIKPGVWADRGARIQRGARILAPAYVGAYSKIRAAAVLTRGAVVEHHSEIDCGTVVEDASVLPYTYVGPGLDLSHSVAGLRRVVHLRRNVSVEFDDPKLVGQAPAAAPMRALAAAATLAGYLPRQFLRGLFAPSQPEPMTELPAALNAPPPALQTPAAGVQAAAEETENSKFPANLVVVRRYGDQ